MVATSPASTPALKRSVGRRMLLVFVIGDILGAGIYALTGKVAGQVGGAIWIPFLLAFGLAALTATAYAELVGRYPRAAGAAVYAQRAFGRPFVTFLVAFAVLMSGITSASAAARAFGGDYLAELVTVPTLVAAWAFVLVVAVVNAVGVSESVRVNLVLTAIEVTGLVVILVIGARAFLAGEGDPGRAMTLSSDGPVWMAVLGGTALAFYALLGFEDSVNLAEECRHPRNDFPRALFGGIAVAGLIYLAVAFTTSMLVDTATLAESTGPLLEVVRVAGLVFPPWLFALIALVAVSNTALINMIMASRVVYGMSREGIVPSWLGRVDRRRRTPWVAIAFTTVIALTLVSTGDLSGLADTTVLLLLLVFAVVNVSVLVLRRRPEDRDARIEGDGPRGFRAPTWAPVAGAVVSLVLASPLTGRSGDVYARAGLLLGIGVVLYVVNRLFVGPARQADAIDASAPTDSP
ncbi:APC family permease [Cellulomonas dongxiuzhuiae]|uniref:APC family permease n=1 Tax=Cellulomonas dongxiuzhuiae TaxID=2819979 RepID=A0ABX8GKK4_9CELL|nr:APC family permease [Cellulomonas dongxiuzhuiae]MBO3087875.1 APC family permease [Cellulomonas dongxiuzhuiae]MBO3094776.1 APC family permease [Cellulomonas dongxiuzhuiae]QWC15769.1 APC family permease [Cellulomonas dongxiuzhuiae]